MSMPRPGRFTPQETAGTHCTGGWEGTTASLDKYGKSRATGIQSLDCPNHSESL